MQFGVNLEFAVHEPFEDKIPSHLASFTIEAPTIQDAFKQAYKRLTCIAHNEDINDCFIVSKNENFLDFTFGDCDTNSDVRYTISCI